MVVVDTHCHALAYWFEPAEILLDEMLRNEVDKAVLTQFFGVYDNSYLVESMRRFPGRFSVVALVDVQRPDAGDRLEELAEAGLWTSTSATTSMSALGAMYSGLKANR